MCVEKNQNKSNKNRPKEDVSQRRKTEINMMCRVENKYLFAKLKRNADEMRNNIIKNTHNFLYCFFSSAKESHSQT